MDSECRSCFSLLCLVADVKQGKEVKGLEGYSLHRWASVSDSSGEQVIANWGGLPLRKGSRICRSVSRDMPSSVLRNEP